jgi:hypothetical protein
MLLLLLLTRHCLLRLLLRLMLQLLPLPRLPHHRLLLLLQLPTRQPLLRVFGLKALPGALMLPVLLLLVRTLEMKLFY